MKERVQELESRLGFRLPDDYRQFLAAHGDSLLDHDLLFKPPRSGIVSELLTVNQILENDGNGRIGIPEKSLMHIGHNLMGGYPLPEGVRGWFRRSALHGELRIPGAVPVVRSVP